jgi:NAD(P)-dependent dehydrogenase (short-subunit alcohol dehydrogenase family)
MSSNDLSGRVALITGATDGIGRLTALRLAARGARVLVHGRTEAKVNKILDEIGALRGAAADVAAEGAVADLAALAQVRALAATVGTMSPRLDILINNAGVGDPRGPRQETIDGHERHFAVNLLAPVLLTRLLVDPLADAAAQRGSARVVMVASVAQTPIDFDDPMLMRDYDGMRAYGRSKLGLIMATMELAATLKPRGICINALHPGTLLDTRMVREGFGTALGPADQGAEAEEYLATAAAPGTVSGAYFDGHRRTEPHRQAADPETRRRLLELIDGLVATI